MAGIRGRKEVVHTQAIWHQQNITTFSWVSEKGAGKS